MVLTVDDIDRTICFYRDILGMEAITFGAGRKALRFNNQKINLHKKGEEIQPNASAPTAGSADLCFITEEPISEVVRVLRANGVAIIEGPVTRTGALGLMESVYCRDPDGNLIELSRYPLSAEARPE